MTAKSPDMQILCYQKPEFGINIQILNNQIKKGLAMNILFQLFQALKEMTEAFPFESVENEPQGLPKMN